MAKRTGQQIANRWYRWSAVHATPLGNYALGNLANRIDQAVLRAEKRGYERGLKARDAQ